MRYYVIVADQALSATENAAQEWDASGDGTGTLNDMGLTKYNTEEVL